MVKAVCGCLNVKIHIRDQGEFNTLPQFHTDSLEIEESRDEFFQQAPREVVLDTPGVGIEHNFLVQSRHVGKWNIFHCTCCRIDTHAVPDSNCFPFLLNPALVVDVNQISKLQQSERFSPVYKVVLPPLLGNSGPSSPRHFPEKGSQADQAVTTIQQMMSSYLKREEEKVEENIQRYTEQQQAALSALEARVRQDRNSLLMLLAQMETPVEKKIQSLSLRDEVTPPTTPTRSGSFSFTPTKELPPPPFRRGFGNPDDDIFEFDSDYLDPNAPMGDPFDTSDLDSEESSHSEGMSIPGRQPIRSDDDSALAKSLPMRVPAMSNYHSQDIDIEDDRTPINPEDMAASIKAIARSVHGGSDSFWDLPRPRLNTLH